MERGALSKSLRTLLELGWIRRELPFDEHSERRALYRVADPFLAFWYRFIAPLASDLQFSDPTAVYAAHEAPRLAEYMGWSVFEEICGQWLQRHAKEHLGLTIRQMARYWSRDGRTEIDLMAELNHGTCLFGECKWRGIRGCAQRPAVDRGVPDSYAGVDPVWELQAIRATVHLHLRVALVCTCPRCSRLRCGGRSC